MIEVAVVVVVAVVIVVVVVDPCGENTKEPIVCCIYIFISFGAVAAQTQTPKRKQKLLCVKLQTAFSLVRLSVNSVGELIPSLYVRRAQAHVYVCVSVWMDGVRSPIDDSFYQKFRYEFTWMWTGSTNWWFTFDIDVSLSL